MSGAVKAGGGSTEKTLALLDALGAADEPVQLATLAAGCDMSKPSAHRVLASLRAAGWVRVQGGGRYTLAGRALAFGARASRSSSFESVLIGLRDEVGHTVHAGVVSGVHVIYTHKVEGHDQFTMRSRVGGTMPLHSTGIGKALLAFGPAALVDDVLATGLTRRTSHTVRSATSLRRELSAIRRRGWAVDDEENEPNVRCIAAAVPSADGAPFRAVSISTVTFLTPREQLLGYADALVSATAALAG